MSSESTGIPLCDGQHDPQEAAAVMCLVHQDFLCLQCLINTKKPECDVKPIDKLSLSESRLFEVLKIKKCLAERKEIVQNHSKTVHEKIDQLKAQIKDHAEELVRKVEENVENTSKDLETQAKTLLDNNNDQEKKIQELEAEISVKTKDAENITQNEINNMQTKLGYITVKNDDTIMGSYEKKLTLSGDSDNRLGKVMIFDHEHYDEVQDNAVGIRDTNGRKQSQHISVCQDADNTCNPSEAGPEVPPRNHNGQRSASVEATGSSNMEDTDKIAKAFLNPPNGEEGETETKSGKEASKNQGESTQAKGSSKTNKPSSKKFEFRPFAGLSGLPDNQLYVHKSSTKPKKSNAAITNILGTDHNALVLLDENKHRIIISDFSGEIKVTHALSKDPIKITKYKGNSFAILNCKDLKIKKFSIEHKDIKTSDLKLSGSVPKPIHVLGFECGKGKDCQQFALSGIVKEEGRVMLINAETGKVSDVRGPFKMSSSEEHHDPGDFKTLYDFEKNAVYILNIPSKSINATPLKRKVLSGKSSGRMMVLPLIMWFLTIITCTSHPRKM
ncbi:uncharacterized protein LOC128237170 [Mya arenaria]|uniref:uncharacterized protein LOC128237170 n=1 Tax=Mya arenaria TaxID=6604 RepID=UPI0022E2312E|nr:uncharacterized protein LOC128237170 [Mya arenaria]XP_052808429.1 uncharacterized protein LOC128237170 [Mya arenaria]